MIRINPCYTQLKQSYLFVEIAKRVQEWQRKNPSKQLISLGIGDVTEPLPTAAAQALHHAADEMLQRETFRGYGPEQGYAFLREAVAETDYLSHDIAITPDDIFISDGSKCDTGNFQELFAKNIQAAVPNPVYPVYADTNIMAGRKLQYLTGTKENGFVPPPPKTPVDLIYLCFPNNPTGAAATKEQLMEYIAYATAHKALILFDAAYAEYITDSTIPRSIYEIAGAETCAVEFRSFSKTAGFTGLRCAYTVIPQSVQVWDNAHNTYPLRDLWLRRQTTKFNGASYPIQKAAAAIYTPSGQEEIHNRVAYYMHNAHIIRKTMQNAGFSCYGGIHSPYVWVEAKRPSWEFFDELLNNAGVVTTPGAGFGSAGEGFIRISAFNSKAPVERAVEKIQHVLQH